MVLGERDGLIPTPLLAAPQHPPGVTHPGGGQGLALQEGHHACAAAELTVNTAAAKGFVHLQKPYNTIEFGNNDSAA